MASNPSVANNPALDQWLAIGPGETVVVRSGKVDIGQRISTAVAMLVADELDVDPARVETVRTETGLSPDEGITSGSYSMTQTGHAVRLAAATARRHLLERAARALDVDPATLEVDDGRIHSRATNRTTSYWEVAEGKPFGIDIDPDAPLKPREALRHVGTAAVAREMEDIVRGRPHFIHDMSLPGMLHARVVRPPHYHARLKSIGQTVVDRLASEGIHIVRDGSFLAVAAPDEYRVARGRGTPRGCGLVGQGRRACHRRHLRQPARKRAGEPPRGRRRAGRGPGAAARRPAGRRGGHARSALRTALPDARLARSIGRDGRIRRRAAHRLLAQPGALFPACRARRDLRHGARRDPYRPRPGSRLLRPQRRRRCRSRRGDRGPCDPRRAGAAQMDARGRACLGALRDLHVDGFAGERGCRRKDRRLVA